MVKKFKILLVIMSLAVTLSIMSNTFSRYVSGATGNIDMAFSKWQILVNQVDITNGSSSSIDLVPVIEENDNVATNTVAPGTKGYVDIDIDPTNVDVSFNYKIDLAVKNEEVKDLIITKYAILDSNYIEGDQIDTIPILNNSIEQDLIYDKTTENFKFEPFTMRIYFEWYEGADEQMDDTLDTEVGKKAASEDTPLEITATINFEQITSNEENGESI